MSLRNGSLSAITVVMLVVLTVQSANAETFVDKLDASLRKETGAATSTAAQPVDDEAFARRAYLDVIGQWPSAAELTAFAFDPSIDKRNKLVAKLLDDSRYGQNWGRYWRDVVLYRRAEDRALIMQGVASDYFTEVLNVNATWDAIATELITAVGDVSEEGSTVLFMAQMGDPNEVASEVSRIFCGVQISCAECHDHPTDRWKREQFHQLAAFFPRTIVRPVIEDGRQRSYAVDSRDFGPRFGGMNANNPRFRPIEHYMPDLKDPAAQGKLMQPVFFATGDKLPEEQTDLQRRETLAQWITSPKNPWFAKSLVNRMWAELVGEGFYEPVDDIGPDRKCSAPQTLELLAQEFTAQGYDLKWLYRTILATEAYQRESRPRRNPEEASFAANCAHRIRADQLYDALLNALGLPSDEPAAVAGSYGGRFALASPRAQFARVFGYDPSAKRDEIAGSIPQALLLMNSPNLAAGINGRSPVTTLGKLLADDRSDESVIVELYLRCLAREPNEKEAAVCLDHLKQAANRVEAFEDVLWSLVNSTEFLHRQ
ncbi:MAG: DUF1553 domain-containing protein [Pirellulales bacterium]